MKIFSLSYIMLVYYRISSVTVHTNLSIPCKSKVLFLFIEKLLLYLFSLYVYISLCISVQRLRITIFLGQSK